MASREESACRYRPGGSPLKSASGSVPPRQSPSRGPCGDAPRAGYEAAFLCSSLAALAIHYGALSADAWLHAAAGVTAPFTPWSAWARASLLVSAGLFFGFLLTVVRRLYAPHSPNPWLIWAVALPSTVALLATLGLTSRLVGDQLGGAAPGAVASDVERFFTGPGRLLASLLFTGPLAFCSALLDRAPSRGNRGGSAGSHKAGPGSSSPDPSGRPCRPTPATPRGTRHACLSRVRGRRP